MSKVYFRKKCKMLLLISKFQRTKHFTFFKAFLMQQSSFSTFSFIQKMLRLITFDNFAGTLQELTTITLFEGEHWKLMYASIS